MFSLTLVLIAPALVILLPLAWALAAAVVCVLGVAICEAQHEADAQRKADEEQVRLNDPLRTFHDRLR